MGTRLIPSERPSSPHSVSVPVSLMLFFFFFYTTVLWCVLTAEAAPRLKIASSQEIIISLGHTGTPHYKIKIKVI